MANKKQALETPKQSVTKFSKEQLLRSKKYRNEKDLINAVLPDGEYTLAEVDKAIKDFKEREVR